VQDLARYGQVRHPEELRPLDVSDDCEVEGAEASAQRGLEIAACEHALIVRVPLSGGARG
jgi:hypothetical protein